MRLSLCAGILGLMLLPGGDAMAQAQDRAICDRITRESYQNGLYVAYPSGSPAIYHLQKLKKRTICSDDGQYCAVPVNGDNVFASGSRFYFLPKPRDRDEEGVWHVRTQTIAKDLRGADRAYVYRPPLGSTRCSKRNALPSFDQQQSSMPISRYHNHHPRYGGGRPPDRGMSDAFHLQIEDKPSSCVDTDNERVYGDLHKLYNFENVTPPPENWAKVVSTSAHAEQVPYAGLSAEFAYQDNEKPLCFGFSAPKPTGKNEVAEGMWIPLSTLVVIKRFVRRSIRQDYREDVTWRK
jgi:hypothetical protein